MSQLVEFVGNHPLLFVAFAATLGMLIWTEWTRISASATSLSPYAATQLVNGGEALFVDVRDEQEYKNGHLLNARNFPVAKLEERMHEIEKLKSRDLVVYCDNGMRTSRATSKLRKQGFEKLHTLAGGITAWEKASLPVVTK